MRRPWTALTPGLVFAIAILTQATAQTPAPRSAIKPNQPEPPIEAVSTPAVGAAEIGSANGMFVSNNPYMASFFFMDRPASCQFTFFFEQEGRKNFLMFKDELKFMGSDMTGNYWQYASLKREDQRWHAPYPKSWFVPKRVGANPGIWYKTGEEGATITLYGAPVEFGQSGPAKK